MIGLGDTIAAISTAAGGSSRGIVRVSGPGTGGVLEAVLEGSSGIGVAAGVESGAVARAVLRLGGAALPVGVLRFAGPRSYTGEDAAEILTVGNPVVLRRVLDRLLDSGARQAGPGEFTARAHLAGKLTLQQAESVGARIAAARDEELDAAERVRAGAFGARCEGWADRLAGLLALVEAGIDFTDQEDVVAIGPAALASGLGDLRGELLAAMGGEAAVEAGVTTPTVVLVGRPNAGKSTLFNALVGRPRAVVADIAGTTRDALAEDLDLGGGTVVRLVDLPGLERAPADGGAADGPDGRAQAAAWGAIGDADLLIHCDPSGRFGDGVVAGDRAVLRVRTKGDLPAAEGLVDGLAGDLAGGSAGGSGGGLAVCALDGWHLEALRRAIADAAERGSGGDALVPRHRRAIRVGAAVLGSALESLDAGAVRLAEPELVASLLREALDEIGSVAGRVTPDEILGRVFASFCVGK